MIYINIFWILLIVFVVFLLSALLILCFVPITVRGCVHAATNDITIDITIKIFSLKIFHIESDKVFKIFGKLGQDEQKLINLKANRKNIYKAVRKTFKKIKLKLVDISIELGVEDAAGTAVLSGTAYIIISLALAFIGNYFTLENIRQNITPVFSKNHLKGDALCIIELRIVNIIYGGLRILMCQKEMKGSVQYG